MADSPHSEFDTVRRGISEPHRANNRHEYDAALSALRRIEEQLEVAHKALYAGGHRPLGTPTFHVEGCGGCAALTGVSFPAISPHEHEWSLPVNAGVYRCMTCGIEVTALPQTSNASAPASRQEENEA